MLESRVPRRRQGHRRGRGRGRGGANRSDIRCPRLLRPPVEPGCRTQQVLGPAVQQKRAGTFRISGATERPSIWPAVASDGTLAFSTHCAYSPPCCIVWWTPPLAIPAAPASSSASGAPLRRILLAASPIAILIFQKKESGRTSLTQKHGTKGLRRGPGSFCNSAVAPIQTSKWLDRAAGLGHGAPPLLLSLLLTSLLRRQERRFLQQLLLCQTVVTYPARKPRL